MSEFKFPDEIEKEKPEEIQVEVEGGPGRGNRR
jgi:hypothetical protein